MAHQQFHAEKIMFLNTLPQRKFPVREKARITLLTANGGVKVKMVPASPRKRELLAEVG